MNPALANLKDLAALDEKLKRIRGRRQKQEEEVESARGELEEAKAHLGDRREEVARLRKEADALNLEVKTAEGEVERLSGQLLGAKSNKEYDVLKREVEAAEKQKNEFEDGVLERLERVDAVTEEERAGKAGVDAAEKALAAASAALEDLEKELAGDEKALKDARETTVSELDEETRRLYEALLAQRGDSAMARVRDRSCSSCARKLSLQMEVLMDAGEEIVQCMSCRRILYLEDEDAGP
ncbi:MAG: zinc ribbon domain-containing protein [Planctomycetota bacterium]|jgi:predicted  nucleic acid-binding Zn-ribbon protein